MIVARLRHRTDETEDFDIVAIPIGEGEPVALTKGVLAGYLAGHLVVLRADGTLEARRIAKGGLALEDASVTIATGIRVVDLPFGAADVMTDDRGVLHFVQAAGGGGSRLE